MPAEREIVTKGFPQGVIVPVRIGREVLLARIQLREEGEPLLAGCGNLSRVDRLRPPDQLPEIVPIECGGIVELRHEGFRIERVAGLPDLEYDEPANEQSIKGSGRKDAEVIDVACLAALIAGANLLGDDLGQGEARDDRRVERKVPEVALNVLSVRRWGKGRDLAAADLELDLALPVRVPVMGVDRIDAPGETVLSLIVAAVRYAEPDPVKWLLECLHHGEDHVFVVVFFDPREIQIGREAPPLPMNILRRQVPPLKASLSRMQNPAALDRESAHT